MDDQNFYAPPQADINPGEYDNVQPRSMGETINEMGALYLSSWQVMLPVALVLGFSNTFFEFLMEADTADMALGGLPGPLFYLSFLGSMVIGVYLWAVGFLRIHNFRRTGEVKNEFEEGFGFFIPIAIFYFLYFSSATLGLLLCLLPGIFIGLLFIVGDAAIVAERAGPIEAFRRSYELVWGNIWYVLGLSIIYGMLIGFPVGVIQVGTELLFAEFTAVKLLVSFVLAVMVFPAWIIFSYVLYESLSGKHTDHYTEETDGTTAPEPW